MRLPQDSNTPVLHCPLSTPIDKISDGKYAQISLMSIRPSDESNRKGERPL